MWYYAFLPRLLNMSLTGSIVILAVLLARLVLRPAPKRFSYLLWAIVLFRLLCPVSLPSALSAFSLTSGGTEVTAAEVFQYNGKSEKPLLEMTVPTAAAAGENASAGADVYLPLAWQIWLGGGAALLLTGVIRWLLLRRRLLGAVRLRENIYLADHIPSPFVVGLLRPKIYLPSTLAACEQDHILLHEQYHIRHLDHVSKLLAFAALCLHWFNPLVWLAFILACRDMEMRCDEAVVNRLGGGIREDYSRSLLRLSCGRRLPVGAPLAFGEGDTKSRIKNVLRCRQPSRWLSLGAAAVCLLMVLCFLSDPLGGGGGSAFGHSYQVESVVYESGIYSFSYTPENAPLYRLTESGELQIMEDKQARTWLSAGSLTEVSLSRENFDDYFRSAQLWHGATAGQLRRNNAQAWRLVVSPELSESVFYYLLAQKNGQLYLTYGYYDQAEAADEASDDSYIRWVFKLTLAE